MKQIWPMLLLMFPMLVTAQDAQEPMPVVEVQTSLGRFTLTLDAKNAPVTVDNFIAYVTAGFYDGTIFHRVIDGFMAQGGGFDIAYNKKETRPPIKNESGNGLRNRRGTIVMARLPDPDSATAQFFINFKDNTSLDARPERAGYAVFGYVSDGMDVVDRMAEIPTGPGGPFSTDVPQSTILIERMSLKIPQ